MGVLRYCIVLGHVGSSCGRFRNAPERQKSYNRIRLVIANIVVFYGFILFELFADPQIQVNTVLFSLLATYSGIALAEMFAAMGLKRLASAQTLSVDTESKLK